jgi:hypothetical protein
MTEKLNNYEINSLAASIGGLAPNLMKTLAIGTVFALITAIGNKIKVRFLVRLGRSTLAFLI